MTTYTTPSRLTRIGHWLLRRWTSFLGIALGLVAGYAIWRMRGGGTLAYPYTATIHLLWGGIIGGIVLGSFRISFTSKK